MEHLPPWRESQPEYLLSNRVYQREVPALEQPEPQALPRPAMVPASPQRQEPLLPAEPMLRQPRPSGLGFSLKYLMWKASFRPSRLTSRAEWQRIDSVDTLCPPLDRTDSVNIPSD